MVPQAIRKALFSRDAPGLILRKSQIANRTTGPKAKRASNWRRSDRANCPSSTSKPASILRYTAFTVEVLHKGRRVASHLRSSKNSAHTTVTEHMQKAHRAHLEWTPSRLLDWARNIGPSTAQLVSIILESRPHPEQGYRACLGVLRLGKRNSDDRLEAACRRAVGTNLRSGATPGERSDDSQACEKTAQVRISRLGHSNGGI